MTLRQGRAGRYVVAAGLVFAPGRLAAGGAAADMAVTVENRPAAAGGERLKLMRYLAARVQLTSEVVSSEEDVRELLQARCGTVGVADLDLFRELNGPIAWLPGGRRSVKLPPCLFWGASDKLPGPSAAGGVGAGPQAALGVPAAPLARPADSVRPTSFVLRPEFTAEAAEIRDSLKRSPLVASAVTARTPRIIRPVRVAGVHCLEGSSGRLLDTDELRAVLGDNARLRTGPRRSVSAVVADTGVMPTEARLPLIPTPNEGDEEGEDRDLNGYYGDRVGVNIVSGRGFPAADPDDGDYVHGTHVAGLVSGRALADLVARDLFNGGGLKIINLKDVSSLPGPGGAPTKSFTMVPAALAQAVAYSTQVNASVLNVSIESDDPIESFASRLGDTGLLVVLAAGNSGRDFDHGPPVYPAYYAVKQPARLISVAASGPDGKLAPFSNFGRDSVDVAAPGVCVDSFLPDGAHAALSGTSQAAPLVSLGAVLLAAEGMTAAAIKQRLMMTVDVDRSLPVRSEGRLNLARALACYQDQLEVRGWGIVRGELHPETTVPLGDGPLRPARLGRLLTNYAPGDAAPALAWVRRTTGEVKTQRVGAPAGVLRFRESPEQEWTSIDWTRVADLVPRECR